MKSKLFSMLMLVVAVFLFGSVQSQPPSDTDNLIEIVDEASTVAATVADAEVSAKIQSVVDNTQQEVGNFLPNYSGDIDYQIISLQAGNRAKMKYYRYRPYMPRSNLQFLPYLA